MLVDIFTFIYRVTLAIRKEYTLHYSCNRIIESTAYSCAAGVRFGDCAAVSVHSSLAHWHGLVQSMAQSDLKNNALCILADRFFSSHLSNCSQMYNAFSSDL
jgi:hypothetical protein